MSTSDKIQLIFERWRASLRDRNRSADNVVANFDELFDDLAKAGATFEEVHELLPDAIKAHQPAPGLIRSFWKLEKSRKRIELSEKEFADKWNGDIADKATNSFFNSFPLPQGPKTSEGYAAGKISEKEYKLMRQHADQFKPIDLNSLMDPNEELMTDEEEILKFIKERLKQ